MPLGVQSEPKIRGHMLVEEVYVPTTDTLANVHMPRKPRYTPHDDLVEILRNCHRRFKDWRYGHLLSVTERLMTHFGIGEGEG